jgi:hypothetical protein
MSKTAKNGLSTWSLQKKSQLIDVGNWQSTEHDLFGKKGTTDYISS